MDPNTGERKWTHRLAAPSTEAGVLTTASNVLFSGGRDGGFYALDARDGKLLWETNLGPIGFGGTHDLHGQWQAVREHSGRQRFVHLRSSLTFPEPAP